MSDTEEEKTAARIKILRDNVLSTLLIDHDPPQIGLYWDNKTSISFFIPYYIKGAWQGKARLSGLILFGFVIYEVLNLITASVPVLLWPINIISVPLIIWLYVSILRCASNGSWKWLGVFIWIFFFILPILGLILWGVQNGIMRMECARDQKNYVNAMTRNASAKIISQKKAVLDACNVQLQACEKDLDKCPQP